MKITELIAQHIIEVHEGGNWTEVNIKDTLEDISYEEAIFVTKASSNSIAALLHHLSFYNEIVLERLMGINPEINDTNGFDVPPIINKNNWQQLKERNIQSAYKLAKLVEQFPEDKLFHLTITGSSTHYKMLQGIVEHAHYHLGQMVLLKKLVKQTHSNIKNKSL